MHNTANGGPPRHFQQVDSPSQAVDRLAALYDEATSALRAAVERFLADGVPPSESMRARFRYPELRVIYQPEGVPPSSAARLRQILRARRLHDVGHAAGGFPRLSARTARTAGRGIRRDDRGRRRLAGNPLPLRVRERRRTRTRRRDRLRTRALLPHSAVECRSATRSPTARSKSAPASSGRSRCSTRSRVDYSLRRLVHYTGSDWRAMQPWLLLTNYHRYVDQFIRWGLEQLRAGAA